MARWSYEMVVEYVEKQGGRVYTTKEEYKNTRVNMKFGCKICGNEIERTFKTYRNGNAHLCKECMKKKINKKRKLSEDEVLLRCNQYGCKLLSPYEDYENSSSIMTLQCSCGKIFKRHFADLREEKDYRCTFCSKHHYYTYEEVYDFIAQNGDKLLSTEYVRNNVKLKIQCQCGEIFERHFNNYKDLKQYHCEFCACSSKGEKIIKEILDEYNIEYIYDKQYFKDLINKKNGVLRPDFILPRYKIWIEFDGIQHFKPKSFGNKDKEQVLENFKNIQENDNIKDEYAKNNGWKMIRIPYTEINNIKEILIEELKL